MSEQLIKSKERVQQHGEVFTPHRIVSDMVDLVRDQCNRLDATFLEPACGDGRFLEEILNRKLNYFTDPNNKKWPKTRQSEWEYNSIYIVGKLYGVDILEDNAQKCRKRLYKAWLRKYNSVYPKTQKKDLKRSVAYLLTQNILCGNALSMMTVDENQNDTGEPIIFPEWSKVAGNMINRQDFRMDVLIKANEIPQPDDGLLPISDLPEDIQPYLKTETRRYLADDGKTVEEKVYVPLPLDRNYKALKYDKLFEQNKGE